jgi:hypothetical protein
VTGSNAGTAAILIAAALAFSCGDGDSSEAEAGCTPPAGYAVCPCGLEPTFDSIRTNVFAKSCVLSECHAASNAINAGDLDLETDPYTALLGSDGAGAPANNISGSVKNAPGAPPELRRIVPGNPDESFLVIKLGTKDRADPKYGSGMPFSAPGSVCPDTLSAIRDWIRAGALK